MDQQILHAMHWGHFILPMFFNHSQFDDHCQLPQKLINASQALASDLFSIYFRTYQYVICSLNQSLAKTESKRGPRLQSCMDKCQSLNVEPGSEIYVILGIVTRHEIPCKETLTKQLFSNLTLSRDFFIFLFYSYVICLS